MTNYKNLIYVLLCLVFSAIIGAAIYEHVAVWPNAFSAPPKSLTMFQGDYKLNPEPFWRSIHPIALLLFVINFVLNRTTERKKSILIAMLGYIAIVIATFVYFVPELMVLTKVQYADTINQELVQRGSKWEMLSLIRLVFAIFLAIILLLGLTKANEKV